MTDARGKVDLMSESLVIGPNKEKMRKSLVFVNER